MTHTQINFAHGANCEFEFLTELLIHAHYVVILLMLIVIFFFPVLLETLSAANENIVFFAGRPFHFYLVHSKTPRLILFEGRFERPEDQNNKFAGADEGNLEPLVHNESGEEENPQPNAPKPTQRPTNGFSDLSQRPLSVSPPKNYSHQKNTPEKSNENNQILNPHSNQQEGFVPNTASKDQTPNFNRNPQPQGPVPQNVNGNDQEFYNNQQNPDVNNGQVYSMEKQPATNEKSPSVVLPFSEQEQPHRPQQWRPQGPSKNSGSYQFDRSGIWDVNVNVDRAWRLQQQQEEQNRRRYQLSRYNF